MRIRLAGWFGFKGAGTTAGYLLSRDVVISRLARAGSHMMLPLYRRLAMASNGARPICSYTHALFVCGPCGNGPLLTEFPDRLEKPHSHMVVAASTLSSTRPNE
jgi:hypothetical protein